MTYRTLILSAVALVSLSGAALADTVTDAARNSGVIGEQADGFVGVVAGQSASAETRAHMDQLNIRRRAAFAQFAEQHRVSVNEAAAALACEFFSTNIEVGHRYRDEGGQWRQRTASDPVHMPSFCPN